ncbi:free fatty acid receptor 3-like [Onychostoma macrolepis]|uniref:free fatty acid receptor 3-like n=1 Tax=Onychostoma macrolepis TaxID=369639 RepID=UPI00272CEF2D|nr:free fatty acid receptor 3-like [Onychostoma macrolepis]XP_058617388.1 free fatty acid receptor 3-like [Onychostoma macrolepis]
MSEDSTAFLLIYIITFLIGFPNAMLAFCSCIRKIQRKPVPIDMFMLNLAVSDLFFLTFLPLKMKEAADNMSWSMPRVLCRFSVIVFFAPLYSSSLFLAAISAERYVCVAFPFKYKSPKRFIYTILICVFIWVPVVIISIFPYMAAFSDSDEVDNNTNKPQNCYINFTAKQLKALLPVRMSLAVLFFLLPLLVCCFCYIALIRILMKCPLFKRQRKLRVIGLLVGTLLVFAISFAPFNASHIAGFIKKQTPNWRMNTLMLSTLNACFDPIIYFCISKDMRKAIKVCVKTLRNVLPNKAICCCCRKLKNGITKISCN